MLHNRLVSISEMFTAFIGLCTICSTSTVAAQCIGVGSKLLIWDHASRYAGNAVANLGDMTGDGLNEFAVTDKGIGSVIIYSGNSSGMPTKYRTISLPNIPFGESVASVGDISGGIVTIPDFIVSDSNGLIYYVNGEDVVANLAVPQQIAGASGQIVRFLGDVDGRPGTGGSLGTAIAIGESRDFSGKITIRYIKYENGAAVWDTNPSDGSLLGQVITVGPNGLPLGGDVRGGHFNDDGYIDFVTYEDGNSSFNPVPYFYNHNTNQWEINSGISYPMITDINTIGVPGDVNIDGIDDFAVGGYSNGKREVFDPVTGNTIFNSPDPIISPFEFSVKPANFISGNRNNCSAPVVFGEPGCGNIEADTYIPNNNTFIQCTASCTTQSSLCAPAELDVVGDVTGDGVWDIVTGTNNSLSPGPCLFDMSNANGEWCLNLEVSVLKIGSTARITVTGGQPTKETHLYYSETIGSTPITISDPCNGGFETSILDLGSATLSSLQTKNSDLHGTTVWNVPISQSTPGTLYFQPLQCTHKGRLVKRSIQ